MSDDRDRALERAQKFLRLAADKSTTDAERVNAALRAAEIFAEHNLVAARAPEKKRKQRPPTPPSAYSPPYPWSQPPAYQPPRYYSPVSMANWTEVEMKQECACGVCGAPLHIGELAYHDAGRYRCHDINCGH